MVLYSARNWGWQTTFIPFVSVVLKKIWRWKFLIFFPEIGNAEKRRSKHTTLTPMETGSKIKGNESNFYPFYPLFPFIDYQIWTSLTSLLKTTADLIDAFQSGYHLLKSVDRQGDLNRNWGRKMEKDTNNNTLFRQAVLELRTALRTLPWRVSSLAG